MSEQLKADFLIKKIDNFMTEKKINKSTFEKNAGLSNGAIDKWKKEKNLPSLKNLIKVAKYMDISLDDLVGIDNIVISGNNFIYNESNGDITINGDNNSVNFNQVGELDNAKKKELTKFDIAKGKHSPLEEIRLKSEFYECNPKFNLLFNDDWFHIVVKYYLQMTRPQQAGMAQIAANIIEENPARPYCYMTDDEYKLVSALRSLSVEDNEDIASYIQKKINAKK